MEKIEKDHIIDTLMREHEQILILSDELEKINRSIQSKRSFKKQDKEYGLLKHIAEHLAGAETHHQREEKVLFPELEKRGIFGPPEVMRQEHEELRAGKKELSVLAQGAGKIGFSGFKKRLDNVSKEITSILRGHIFKENNILYPAAIDAVREKKTWDEMKTRADGIGYCCFTPAH